MSDFISYTSNTEYIKAFTEFKTGKQKKLIYVEDKSDIFFWEKLIEFIDLDNYEIMVYDNNKIKGKRILETRFEDVSEYFMMAIDSDYDYLCPNHRKGKFLENKYILHTFGYSKESVLIEKDRLDHYFKNVKHTINHKVEINNFLAKFSKICFKGLSLYINEIINNRFEIKQCSFDSCFNILGEKLINEDDLSISLNVLDEIYLRIKQLFPNEINHDEYEKTLSYLGGFNIDENNAYRFISGHVLSDLISKIDELLKKYLLKKELELDKEHCKNPIEIPQRRTNLSKIFENQFSIDTFYRFNFYDPNDILIVKIQNKIRGLKCS